MTHPQPSPWTAPTAAAPVRATVPIPGSKSITNRALLLAALAENPSTLHGPLRSRDTELMAHALRTLGVGIADGPDGQWHVTPGELRGPAELDCGLAGTVMRFLPPAAALASGEIRFDGDPYARQRPMTTLLGGLRGLGVDVVGDALPFTLRGTGSVAGGQLTVDASGSSQFVSGLLLSAARYTDGILLVHNGKPVPSLPHIDMTVEMLRAYGVSVDDATPDTWRVESGPIRATDWQIEPDLSNATPFLAAAAVTGGEITVPDWPTKTTQAGDAIRDILATMGAEVRLDERGLTVRGPATLTGIDVDLHDVGELTPTIAALAAFADGPSYLHGIAHLRGHETDRLAAITSDLNGLGGDSTSTVDGVRIRPAPLRGGRWRAFADHRMATAGAIIGLRVPGVEVDDVASTGKTLPGFPSMWAAMLDPAAPGLDAGMATS